MGIEWMKDNEYLERIGAIEEDKPKYIDEYMMHPTSFGRVVRRRHLDERGNITGYELLEVETRKGEI